MNNSHATIVMPWGLLTESVVILWDLVVSDTAAPCASRTKCLQNLDPVGGAYFGLKAPPSSLLVRPQQPPARLMLLWARSARSRSHSDWLCARSGRTICTGGVEDVGCEEMVRSRWLRFRKKSPLPPSPKLPFRRTRRVLPVLAGLDLWLYSSCDRWDA